jgi:hypothetical protein
MRFGTTRTLNERFEKERKNSLPMRSTGFETRMMTTSSRSPDRFEQSKRGRASDHCEGNAKANCKSEAPYG